MTYQLKVIKDYPIGFWPLDENHIKPVYAIGDIGPGGGIVFYDAGSEQPWGQYLEAANAESSPSWTDPRSAWSGNILQPVGTSTAIGTGAANTTAMIAQNATGGKAATLCRDYRGGGLSDWFLPSIDELVQLFSQKAIVGGFVNDQSYWSSSNHSPSNAWYLYFSGNGTPSWTYKGSENRVRPVRAFISEPSTLVSDISGCGNNATYVGSPASNILPLVSGGLSGTRITDTAYVTVPVTKDYYGATVGAGFATAYTSDNDFTIEAWVYPSIESTSVVRLFGDIENNIGLFWDNGHIVFKVSDTDYVISPLSYSKKVLYLAGKYSVNSIDLYVDGVSVAFKSIRGHKFSNTSLNLQIGPTLVEGDEFTIDAPAIYRYGLSDKIIVRHYVNANATSSAIQVSYPDEGVLYSGSDANIKSVFDYSYPVNKPWVYWLTDDTYFDLVDRNIGFYETETAEPKSFVINDFFVIPSGLNLITSKVEWRNDLGITVETSTDGISYSYCQNGQPLPQYTKDAFHESGNVYIRITMSTPDASKYLPTLSFFCIAFYSNKDIFADNYGDKITSDTEYYLGSLNYPILSRNYMNGIRAKDGAGFDVNTLSSIKSVEMFFTPLTLASNTLFYASDPSDTRVAWDGSGVVSKANIDKIYINNVDVTSQTNINNYLVTEEPHHVVIVFTTPVTGALQFNYELSGGPSNLYKNITTYEKELSPGIVETHYELYTGKAVSSVTEPAITLTESDIIAYNNDWIVLQSV